MTRHILVSSLYGPIGKQPLNAILNGTLLETGRTKESRQILRKTKSMREALEQRSIDNRAKVFVRVPGLDHLLRITMQVKWDELTIALGIWQYSRCQEQFSR